MSFEAEVIPLFIGGVIAVSILELIIGLIYLKGKKCALTFFILHIVSMLGGFFFLTRGIFSNWLNIQYDIASISNSMNVGAFGLLWMVSAFMVIGMIEALVSK